MPSSDSAAFDRLRDVFRPPRPFGPDDLGPRPPGAALRSSPQDPGGQIRLDPRVPGLRVLATVGVLAALLAGVLLWWSRPEAQPAPAAAVSPAAHRAAPAGASSPAPGPPAVPAPPTGSASAVLVDVGGKVRRPGVVSLPAGARVIDAIKAAGGVRPGARTGALNLARRVVDGEQILVGVDATPAPALAPGATPGATAPGAAPLDLNTADAAQLDRLPGVGPVLAQRIVDYRTRHGAFRSVEELRQVSGIGAAKFGDLKNLVTV
ncbi:ComEA family DNA-binding protein [Actinoallomurus spadix]|uniref:Helix-hairpin-helix DNA-binding motif class 1 domain-containing protein n=1 Tax=Actinoallomurus spadix TaxID=79912 RepID=A0ABN0VTW0_9ACTN|nr:ComEA family DNA-binding protein [Actinoallomurus spadix]MCO5987511.1 ComEA family DNA-binding protein [Actinoallomurus spadix]